MVLRASCGEDDYFKEARERTFISREHSRSGELCVKKWHSDTNHMHLKESLSYLELVFPVLKRT